MQRWDQTFLFKAKTQYIRNIVKIISGVYEDSKNYQNKMKAYRTPGIGTYRVIPRVVVMPVTAVLRT